ncbi:MAG: ABC transporter permease [Alistipes sp.]|nr:ABC transporter permease [Alistipes sp.]MBR3846378.1 ABC transporter permease [Alistipes sp.]
MKLELEIARRMAAASKGGRRSVMERIAVISVALSMAVMLLSMAVIMGFKEEIAQRMGAVASHVVVSDVRSVQAVDRAHLRATSHLDSLIASVDGFRRSARYALHSGIIRTQDAVEGVVLKGVDRSYDAGRFAAWLQAGELPRIGDSIRTKDILLSRGMAQRLEVEPGDRLEILFVDEQTAPFRDRFKVAGIYSSGLDELDDAVAFTDLRNVQRLSGLEPDQVTGYEIETRDLAEAPAFAAALDHVLLYDESDETINLTAQAVQSLYPHIFDWLKAHDVNAVVILVIMLIVAFFNMASALLILVLERIRTIGILRAVGMQRGAVRRVFLYRAAMIALRGLLWGNLVAGLLCWIQWAFAPIRLDSEGYLLSAVPIAWGWWWPMVVVGFLAAILLLMWLPASVAASIKPDETMRYE